MRDCLSVIELTEQFTSARLLAATQALVIIKRENKLKQSHFSTNLKTMMGEVLSEFTYVDDRPLGAYLRHFMSLILNKHWKLYKGCIHVASK